MYSRAVGVACGLFLIAWIPFNAERWQGQAPGGLLGLEAVYFLIYGVLLALPWSKITGQKLWRGLFTALCVLSIGFGFLMVVDLMFLYMLAAEQAKKVAPPAFQSLLLFTALIQAPTVLFVRYPRSIN